MITILGAVGTVGGDFAKLLAARNFDSGKSARKLGFAGTPYADGVRLKHWHTTPFLRFLIDWLIPMELPDVRRPMDWRTSATKQPCRRWSGSCRQRPSRRPVWPWPRLSRNCVHPAEHAGRNEPQQGSFAGE